VQNRLRPPVILIADSLGLDFPNSITTPLDTPVDLRWLRNFERCAKWKVGLTAGNVLPANQERR